MLHHIAVAHRQATLAFCSALEAMKQLAYFTLLCSLNEGFQNTGYRVNVIERDCQGDPQDYTAISFCDRIPYAHLQSQCATLCRQHKDFIIQSLRLT